MHCTTRIGFVFVFARQWWDFSFWATVCGRTETRVMQFLYLIWRACNRFSGLACFNSIFSFLGTISFGIYEEFRIWDFVAIVVGWLYFMNGERWWESIFVGFRGLSYWQWGFCCSICRRTQQWHFLLWCRLSRIWSQRNVVEKMLNHMRIGEFWGGRWKSVGGRFDCFWPPWI